jgi:hypothetical protein
MSSKPGWDTQLDAVSKKEKVRYNLLLTGGQYYINTIFSLILL